MNQLIQQGLNLDKVMFLKHPNYKQRAVELFQDIEFKKKKTLCIDVMTVFLQKVEIDQNEFHEISSKSSFKFNYILVKNQKNDPNCCRRRQLDKPCLCNKTLYRIREYTYNFLRALAPFYETICFSKMPTGEIK